LHITHSQCCPKPSVLISLAITRDLRTDFLVGALGTRTTGNMTGEKIKPGQETRTYFTFPSLHGAVATAVLNDIPSTWFNEHGGEEDCNNRYSTNVLGKFRCKNNKCRKHGWASKRVTILIQGYSGNGYHAVVFNQRCLFCRSLGTLTLDEPSYVERVAYRLKKWAGVMMEKSQYAGARGLPHKPELCEGCKRGLCQQRYD
jgi:hypothetical protein